MSRLHQATRDMRVRFDEGSGTSVFLQQEHR